MVRHPTRSVMVTVGRSAAITSDPGRTDRTRHVADILRADAPITFHTVPEQKFEVSRLRLVGPRQAVGRRSHALMYRLVQS
jgi:peptidoglycan/xylan/chitin deacetylase (PgdA/CDA1 family)